MVQSEYAVVAAEQTALERLSVRLADQIVARVALYARQARAAPSPSLAPLASPSPGSGEGGAETTLPRTGGGAAPQAQGEGTPRAA